MAGIGKSFTKLLSFSAQHEQHMVPIQLQQCLLFYKHADLDLEKSCQ